MIDAHATAHRHTIRTERLQLRPPIAHDRHALFAIHADAEVAPHLLPPAWETKTQADTWIQAAALGWQRHSQWRFVVIESQSGACIGTCQLFHIDHASARAEIGYVLGRTHWGHGYMSEALGGIVEWAFAQAGLRRIEAEIDPANRPSARLLERAGFVWEGRLRERWCLDGRLSDSDFYGLLSSDARAAAR